MKFNIFSTIFLAANLTGIAVAAPTNHTSTLMSRDTDSTDTLVSRDDTVAIIGTWDDKQCRNAKIDDSIAVPNPDHYSNCKELRGNSMQVFWLKKGCTSTYPDGISLMGGEKADLRFRSPFVQFEGVRYGADELGGFDGWVEPVL